MSNINDKQDGNVILTINTSANLFSYIPLLDQSKFASMHQFLPVSSQNQLNSKQAWRLAVEIYNELVRIQANKIRPSYRRQKHFSDLLHQYMTALSTVISRKLKYLLLALMSCKFLPSQFVNAAKWYFQERSSISLFPLRHELWTDEKMPHMCLIGYNCLWVDNDDRSLRNISSHVYLKFI